MFRDNDGSAVGTQEPLVGGEVFFMPGKSTRMRRQEGHMNDEIQRAMGAEARRTMLADAAQHPVTLLPMAVVAAGAIYRVLLSTEFGGEAESLVLMVGAGTVAFVSFAWIYSYRRAEKYHERLSELMAIQHRNDLLAEIATLDEYRQELEQALDAIDFDEGRKALDELASEYESLKSTLDRQERSASMSMAVVPGLADRTYRRGLSVLEDALGLKKTERAAGRRRLETEKAVLEMEVGNASLDALDDEEIEIKKATLASHRKRLEMIGRLRLHANRLVHQASRCEASLAQARIELAEVEAGSAEAKVTTVVQALEGTVQQVKDVQEELRTMGY
jgi:hypothetical protein